MNGKTYRLPLRHKLTGGVVAVAIHLLILGYLIFVLFPFYWTFLTSIKSLPELFRIPPGWWPEQIDWSHYIVVWRAFPLARYFLNSLFITLTTTLLGVAVASLAGYSLSRFRFKGNAGMVTLLLVTQMLPGIVTIVPFYFWMMQLGLINNYLGLILAYTTWSVPFCTLMLRSYFSSSFPGELEESARIDGCTKFQAFYKIALPVSAPGLVAAGSFAFMLAWKEFMWASIMLTRGAIKPLAVGLYDMIGEGGQMQFLSMFMAASVMSTIPVIIIFLMAQRFIVQGLTAGAVKG